MDIEVKNQDRLVQLMLDQHLGNFLVATPVLSALAQHEKNLLVIHEPHAELAKRIPTLKGPIVTLPRTGSPARDFIGFIKLLHTVRSTRPTIALDFGGSGSGGWLGAMSGAPRRICRDSAPYARRFSEHVAKPEGMQHRIEIYGAIGRAVVPELEWGWPKLEPLSSDHANLEETLRAHEIDSERPMICLHVAGGKEYKHWPLPKYAQVIDTLRREGKQPILIGAGPDHTAAQEVQALCEDPPVNLVQRLGIGSLIALFERASLFIGNDSGPMHMAAATGTPVVALFGPTDPVRWGPLTNRALIVRGTEHIPPEQGKKKFADGRRMDSIRVDDVVNAIRLSEKRFAK
ncbi:glycosyltransferase family 9 protein [Thioalkalivibrio sp. ALRh]|uniref:glycosyltransferase family 9 protein n=1 Tax=Thioalkalivibrio sp. ALRh TaxID=1266911 RepID=UPI001E4DC015|nr:glycosyltransferase family 9 protein [Thioalkalivibrio sp. ALRh]